MAPGLNKFAWILFVSMLSLIIIPTFFSIFSDSVAHRVHETESVIIASFGACGTLVGWIKTLEQWALNKKGDQ